MPGRSLAATWPVHGRSLAGIREVYERCNGVFIVVANDLAVVLAVVIATAIAS